MIGVEVHTLTESRYLEFDVRFEDKKRHFGHCCLGDFCRAIEEQWGWDRTRIQLFDYQGECITSGLELVPRYELTPEKIEKGVLVIFL